MPYIEHRDICEMLGQCFGSVEPKSCLFKAAITVCFQMHASAIPHQSRQTENGATIKMQEKRPSKHRNLPKKRASMSTMSQTVLPLNLGRWQTLIWPKLHQKSISRKRYWQKHRGDRTTEHPPHHQKSDSGSEAEEESEDPATYPEDPPTQPELPEEPWPPPPPPSPPETSVQEQSQDTSEDPGQGPPKEANKKRGCHLTAYLFRDEQEADLAKW